MRMKLFGMLGCAGAAVALACTIAVPSVNGAAGSQTIPQPSPRPTLVPTALPTALPTARPTSAPKARTKEPSAPAYGHVTGTVIDQRTGAPAANMPVFIGGERLMTDSNGNYDHWMPVGSYSVSLAVTSEQGHATAGTAVVNVTADSTTVQHLFFESLAPQPQAQPEATAVLSASPEPTAVAKPKHASAKSAPKPKHLPTTSAEDEQSPAWVWAALLAVVCGGMLSLRPVRLALLSLAASHTQTSGDNSNLLTALLTAQPRSPKRTRRPAKADSALLESLLRRDE